jgi:DNA polymerase III delta subunit
MAVPHPDKELDRLRAACKSGLPKIVALVGTSAWFRQEALDAVLASLPNDIEVVAVEGQDVALRGKKAAGDGDAEDGDADRDEAGDEGDDGGGAKAHCADLQPLAGGGLFAQSAAVVVRRGDRWMQRYATALAAFAPRIKSGSILVFEAQKLDKRTKFAKELATSGAVYEFRELYETPFGRPDQPLQGELVQWVIAHSKRLSVPVTPESALLLTAQVGREPALLAAELEQLAGQFDKKGSSKALSPEDLRGKLTCSFESTPFELAEAILDGDRKRALRSLHAMFARGVKQKDGKRMDQGGLFPFATSWMFSSITQVYEGRLMMDQGMSLRDVPQKLGVYAFVERFTAQVQKNTAARLEHGILALLHCQRERRSLGEEDDVLLERFLARWFDGVAVPSPEELEW